MLKFLKSSSMKKQEVYSTIVDFSMLRLMKFLTTSSTKTNKQTKISKHLSYIMNNFAHEEDSVALKVLECLHKEI